MTTAATAQFDYFDHDADTGIIGRGTSLEAAFEAAAVAVFAIMGDLAQFESGQSVTIEFDEDDIEVALVRWLNGLVAEARVRGVLFSDFEVKRAGDHWSGEAKGGPWPRHAERGVEVKGATLTALSVTQNDGEWTAQCVVDV